MKVPEGMPVPAITAVGRGVGRRDIYNADVAAFLGKRPEAIETLIRRQGIGIEHRYWVEFGEQATSDLCVDALTEALETAGLKKEDIRALYIATSSPDLQSVSTAAIVQHKLGLPNNLLGSNNADACPGWVHGVYRATTDLTSPLGRGGIQVVIGAETISPVLSPKKGVVSALFGDAAGATVFQAVQPDSGDLRSFGFGFGLDGQYAEDLGIRAGGSLRATSAETLGNDWHTLDMNTQVVFEQAVRRMKEVTEEALRDSGIPIEEVDLLIPHQANKKIIEATAYAIGIPMDKVIVTIGEYGNTSSGSIPTALYTGIRDGRIRRNMIIATASFGAGLGYASAILPMVGLPKK